MDKTTWIDAKREHKSKLEYNWIELIRAQPTAIWIYDVYTNEWNYKKKKNNQRFLLFLHQNTN